MRLRQRISISLAGLSGLAFLALNNPTNIGFLPSCQFHSLTGFECPGCGATRCVHELLNGNALAAADYNVLTVIGAPWALWRYGQWLIGHERNVRPVRYRWIIAVGLTVVGFGVLRNVNYGLLLPLAASQ
jgi:hypothetical protein